MHEPINVKLKIVVFTFQNLKYIVSYAFIGVYMIRHMWLQFGERSV